MYFFLNSQIYEDCGISFDIKFLFIDQLGVFGVDSEQYETYRSFSEIEKQEPSNFFDFYHYRGKFRAATINEILNNDYLKLIDGYIEVDDSWQSGLRFDDYIKKVHYFKDSKEKDEFIRKII